MPWPLFNRPSIQLGALASYLRQAVPEIEICCKHPYLSLAEELGVDLYHGISQNMWVCEALYAGLVFPEKKASASRLIAAEIKAGKCPDFDIAATITLVSRHLDRFIASIDWASFKLAAFSVCFHQFFPSLAAARRIRERAPDLVIAMGGSAMLAGMDGIMAELAGVDHVMIGEGELALADLCRRLAEGDFPGKIGASARRQLPDLNSLPVPDYRDYFREMQQVFGKKPFIPVLPVEFSRGCWWGRCSFCNLNQQWSGYRFKRHQQMLDEIAELIRRHRCLDFSFTDNALPVKEARRFFAVSAGLGDVSFFAELRADQSSDLAGFAAGGLTEAQIGIEALSPGLLTRMNKGATVMANVFALKSAMANRVRLSGNLITCFPGSTDTEVAETLRVLDFVLPYQPLAPAAFFLGHGSPIAADPASHGILAITAHPKFRHLVPQELLPRLPQLVKGYRGDQAIQRRRWRPVLDRLRQWRLFHSKRDQRQPALSLRDGGDFCLIRQETLTGEVLHHRLAGVSRRIYLGCDQPTKLAELRQLCPTIPELELISFLDGLCEKRLLFQEGDSFLALAIRSR